MSIGLKEERGKNQFGSGYMSGITLDIGALVVFSYDNKLPLLTRLGQVQ